MVVEGDDGSESRVSIVVELKTIHAHSLFPLRVQKSIRMHTTETT